MENAKKPTKASRERHEKFRKQAQFLLVDQGAVITQDDVHMLCLKLSTRIGTLEFSMFKSHGEQGNIPSQELYCLFIRLDAQNDFKETVEWVNRTFRDKMSLSGKWNIFMDSPKEVFWELDNRLDWLKR